MYIRIIQIWVFFHAVASRGQNEFFLKFQDQVQISQILGRSVEYFRLLQPTMISYILYIQQYTYFSHKTMQCMLFWHIPHISSIISITSENVSYIATFAIYFLVYSKPSISHCYFIKDHNIYLKNIILKLYFLSSKFVCYMWVYNPLFCIFFSILWKKYLFIPICTHVCTYIHT